MTDASAKGADTEGKSAAGKPADNQPTADKSKAGGTPSPNNDNAKHGNGSKKCACDKCDCSVEVGARCRYCARCIKRCHKPGWWRQLLKKGFAKSKKSGAGWERLDEEWFSSTSEGMEGRAGFARRWSGVWGLIRGEGMGTW
jgi:hypothetical protein